MNLFTSDSEKSLADAVAAGSTAVSIDPDNGIVPSALGLGAFLAGDSARAQASFERAAAMYRAPGPLATLRWFFNTQGRYTEALAPLEEAATRVPRANPADAYLQLAVAHFGLGRDDEALRNGELALQLGSDPVAHGLVACILGHFGRIDAAQRELARVPPLRLRDVDELFQRLFQRPLLDRVLAGLRLAGMPE